MLYSRRNFLAILVLGLAVLGANGQDDDVAQRQKKRAAENWKRAFDNDPGIVHESLYFIFVAPAGFEQAKVRALADTMDNYFSSLKGPLGGPAKKQLWPGKMAVYLFTEKRNINSLIRTVEKRRPSNVGLGSFYLKGEQIHIAACTPVSKEDPSQEKQAILQLFDAAFTKFAGAGNGIAEWVTQGYMDATAWENDSGLREKEMKEVQALADHKKSPKNIRDLFAGTLKGRERYLIQTSLVDFLAYGPQRAKFPEFLRAFKVERNRTKAIGEVLLSSLDTNETKLNRHWLVWVRKGGKEE